MSAGEVPDDENGVAFATPMTADDARFALKPKEVVLRRLGDGGLARDVPKGVTAHKTILAAATEAPSAAIAITGAATHVKATATDAIIPVGGENAISQKT